MLAYRYKFTPGDSKDGLGSPQEYVFEAKNDEEARKEVKTHNEDFLELGGFVEDEKLEKGHLVESKIAQKVFKLKYEIPIEPVPKFKKRKENNGL